MDLDTLFERYAAAWTARDLDAIIAFHSEDTMFWLHVDRSPVTGREQVRDAFAELFDQWPEFGFETQRVFVGLDHWVLDWTLTAVLTDSVGARRPARFDCLDVVTVEPSGLVWRKDTFVDLAQAQRSLLHSAAPVP